MRFFRLFSSSEQRYLKPHKLLWEGIPSGSLSTCSNALAGFEVVFALFPDGAASVLQTFQRESLQICKGTGLQPVPAALLSKTLCWLAGKSCISPSERKECEQCALICAVAE